MEGLYDKYVVYRRGTKQKVAPVFVLKPDKDPAALEALKAYAKATKNELLADQLMEWVKEFDEHACIGNQHKGGNCPKAKSPVCCAYCPLHSQCFDEFGIMCYYVYTGDVASIEECTFYEDI